MDCVTLSKVDQEYLNVGVGSINPISFDKQPGFVHAGSTGEVMSHIAEKWPVLVCII